MTNNKIKDVPIIMNDTKKDYRFIRQLLIHVVLILWTLLAIFPLYWMIINSFKPSQDVIVNSLALPLGELFTLENYKNIFTSSINILTAFKNSLIVSGFVVVITIIISLMASFALARYSGKLISLFSSFVVACMMFPAFSLMFPLYSLFDTLNLINTYPAVILPQIALNMGFTTIMLTGFLKSLPMEVEESAYIDGARIPRVIISIIIPMMKSALVTCVIFTFLWSYNELFFQTFLMRTTSMKTIPSIMIYITTLQGTDFGRMAASAAIISIPMAILYLFLQNHIIKGLTAGAVKG